jgi:ABC-type ATPase involved in cell division
MLTVFGKVASDFGIVYADLLDLKKRTVVLQGLSRFFNMETETSDLKVLSRKRRALTHQSRRSLTYQSEAPRLLESPKKGASKIKCPLTDMMLLEMRSVTLQYEPAPPLILRAKAAAYQGTLVCISSCGSGAGRQSLMRALAYKKFPSIGMISIPSHLRVVHVSSEPCILDRSAWGNLTFACSTEDPSRVLDICHQLEMSFTQQVLKKDLERMGMLTPELCRKCDVNKTAADSLLDHEDGTKWQHRLTDSEIAKIHLARAFVMNPEVLVLQRPFRRFSEGQGERRRLMDAIRNHINLRGLGLDPKTAGRRRPRTVFFTAEAKSQEEEADVVWTIMEDKSIAMRLGGQSASSSKKPVSNGVLDAMSLSSGTSGTSSVSALFWPCRVAAKATVEKDT